MGETQAADVGYTLAANIAKVKYEDIPVMWLTLQKRAFLTHSGRSWGEVGQGQELKRLLSWLRTGVAKKRAPLLAMCETNAWMAAFANGAMAHALDYDNVHDDAFTHPTLRPFRLPWLLPNVWNESTVKSLSRQWPSVMTCIVDWPIRLKARKSFYTGCVDAAVGAGWIRCCRCIRQVWDWMGEDSGRFWNTLNRTGGSLEIVLDPGLLRGLYTAFPSITGVLAALMAERGIPGIKSCFEGRAGLYNVYFREVYDRAWLTKGLGEVFEGASVSFKPWPACRFTNPYIDATLQIVKSRIFGLEL